MHILEHVPLKDHSTMRLGGEAAYLTEVSSVDELREALAWADERQLPVMMIGSGSNIVWRDEGFPGLVIANRLRGYDEHAAEDGGHVIRIGAGEDWDAVVARTVERGLSGLESLSLIPGTAGATPVQNVGAYGREIADVLLSVEAYDRQTGEMVTIMNRDCAFSYRMSRFKGADKGRFFIIAITVRLTRNHPKPPFYRAVEQYFDEQGITEYTAAAVRQAVIAIRRAKLPDPAEVANNGSFFGNPIISTDQFASILAGHPDIPHWEMPDGQIKLPAGWLMEQAGLKGVHDDATGMATWPAQALVLVNEHARSTADLLTFKARIVDTIQQQFGITLEQEPELLP